MWVIFEKREESGDSWNGLQFERIQFIMVLKLWGQRCEVVWLDERIGSGLSLFLVIYFRWGCVLVNYYSYLNFRWFRFYFYIKYIKCRILKGMWVWEGFEVQDEGGKEGREGQERVVGGRMGLLERKDVSKQEVFLISCK